jgi:hypothetical protein
MSPAGWLMMIVSYGVVLGLSAFCFYRVLMTPGTEVHEHAPLDIDTRDADPRGSGTSRRSE